MKTIKNIELPRNWRSIAETLFDEIRKIRPSTPKKQAVRKLLEADGTKEALEILLRHSKSVKDGWKTFMLGIEICAYWRRFAAVKITPKDVVGKDAMDRAKELRAAQACPMLNEMGKQCLEFTARWYDWVGSIPVSRGPQRKATFRMTCALELSNLFIKSIGTPAHAATSALLLSTFGSDIEEDSVIKMVGRGRNDPVIKNLAYDPDSDEIRPLEYLIKELLEQLTQS